MLSSRNNTLEFSSAGSILLNDGAVSNGRFGAIQILQDTVIDSVEANNVDQTTHVSYTAKSFNAGTILYGDFTNVSITSGLVALHKV
jgi:hypothetical protein|tara:strand:+ start:239 stop:499 length:261 start_codon:yes stop_codon:yes gene_type:complete